jgi:hypothetical protein
MKIIFTKISLVLFAIVISSCCTTGAKHSRESLVITDESYGAVRFGDTLSETEKRVGEKADVFEEEGSCKRLRFAKYPAVNFMVEKGVVVRVDGAYEAGSIPNAYDIKMGDSLESLKARFPAMKMKPHTYVENGHYLIFNSKDGKRAVLFEEKDGKVAVIRAGLHPAVGYIEGCH